MKIRISIGAVAGLALACAGEQPREGVPADLAFLGGAIYTVDAEKSWAEAVAIRGGVITAVGSEAEVRPLIGPETRVVALDGKMLLPGFHDAHIHPVYAGLGSLECPLHGLGSLEAILEKLRACAASGERRGDWLVGSGWDVSLFPDGNAPKEPLDELAPDFPIALTDENGHAVWVNSKALELAGVRPDTPNPPAGVIERDPNSGEASGTLRESAAELVYDVVPAATEARMVEGAQMAVRKLHSVGVTSVVDAAVGESQLKAYRTLADRGELDLRVVACIEFGTNLVSRTADAEGLISRRADYRRPGLSPDCIKLFADGVLEGETAAMLEPYVGRPGYLGEPTFEPEELAAIVTRFDAEGLQIHVHAIGDGGVRASLDAFEAARQANGERDARHHIAHLQIVHPDDITRFADLDVVANFQAIWAYPDEWVMNLNLPVIGEKRLGWMYPIGSIHRAGGRLALGTDWDVSPPDALPGIEVGLRRQDPTGAIEGALNPGEGLDLATLIEAYTLGGAYVMHQEDETGSIEVGKAADLVVLEKNLFEIPAQEISEVRVLETFVNGESVFSAL